MQKILVSVNADLVTDQRMQKVCRTLHEVGYVVFLVGRKSKNSLPLVRPYQTHRIKTLFQKGFLGLAEWNIRLFFKLLFTKKDILLSNDLDTLLANYMAYKFSKAKLVYDTHELFTEIPELINRPKVQGFWLKIERFIFPKLKNVYTVCGAIATYYQDKYNVPVAVVRNMPLQRKEIGLGQFPFDTNGKKILLYQGALNKGRGLELLIETIPLLSNWLLVIVGDGTITNELQEKVSKEKLTDKVIFMGRLLPKNLAKITPLATVGVSVEEDLGLSYHYALPNKIFDYIHAKVPILVSDLPEMRKIVADYNVGSVLKNRSAKNIAKQLEKIARTPKATWGFDTAISKLNWQKEAMQLLEIYRNLR